MISAIPQLRHSLTRTALLMGTTLLVALCPTWAAAADPEGEAAAILARLKGANQLNDAKFPSRVYFSNANQYNAGTDGRRILFTLKLWNALQDDDQRAFVLAHEVAHISLNHVPKSTARRVASSIFARLVGNATGNPLLATAGVWGIQLLDLKFERGDEFQADDLGIQMMKRAGYRPKAAVETLELLGRLNQGGPAEFLRTHPLSTSRIRVLANKYSLQ